MGRDGAGSVKEESVELVLLRHRKCASNGTGLVLEPDCETGPELRIGRNGSFRWSDATRSIGLVTALTLFTTLTGAGDARRGVEAMETTEADDRILRLVDGLADPDARVRREAISELVDIGGRISLRIVEEALLDADPEVRKAAMDAVIDSGGGESAWSLAVVLNGEDTALREEAVHALGEIGGEIAIVILKQALADEETESVRSISATD